MTARRRTAKGALAKAIGAILFTAALVLQGSVALADAPWPKRPPGQDPYRFEGYRGGGAMPDDYSPSDPDFWKHTGEGSGSLYHTLIRIFAPAIHEKELKGTRESVDRAWSVTTGRPEVVVAVLDSGVKWHDREAMAELSRKFRLNPGEIPPPLGAAAWDADGNGVFNADDYAGDPRVCDLNGNATLDPQDLIRRFSEGTDGDGNGYVDDICGWDLLEDDNDPWDELDHGDGTAECAWSAGDADNGAGVPGTCPDAMLLPVRVGGSFIVDANRFAQGVIFAVDSGAWLIQGALGSVNNSPLGQAAVDYAYSRGVAVVASTAVEVSARQSFPCAYERAIQVNAVQKHNRMGSFPEDQHPLSRLYLGGFINYGARATVSAPSDGRSSGATGRLAGIAALVCSAAENAVRRGDLWRYPGLDRPLSACEVKQILAMTSDDIDDSPDSCFAACGRRDAAVGPSGHFCSTPGWDPCFGYGIVDAYEAVKAVEEGRIPPEAEINSPRWLELIDPGRVTLAVEGRVAAVRADAYGYVVEWAPGWSPMEGDWRTARNEGPLYEPVWGTLATLDLGQVYRAVMESVEERGEEEDSNRYAFTIRVRVRDSRGVWGEDRKAAFCFRDPDAYGGTPAWMGADVSASPRFADLNDDGTEELIVATGDGLVHALSPDLGELPGWPVHATPLPLHEGSAAFRSGAVQGSAYASVIGTPAVGDLDRDGDLEVVAGDTEGRIYAWDGSGRLMPGFPVRSNPLYSIPDRADWWTPGALPDGWHAARFAPDAVHRLNRWNCLDKGFLCGPVLSNLDSSPEGSLEIIAACLDQHLYAWHADGSAVAGWPVKLVDTSKVATMDPVTHTCVFHNQEFIARGSNIVTNPSVVDLEGDGRLEVVCGTNEDYPDEALNVLPQTLALSLLLPFVKPLIGGAAGSLFDPGNARVYAVRADGAAHSMGAGAPADRPSAHAYLPGWPAGPAMTATGTPSNVVEGVNGPVAIADLDGDGSQETISASSHYDIHAVNASGAEPAGWPKFTGGWSVATPAVGDWDGDGRREVITGTREGWLLAWRTSSSREDAADWPEYGHDSWGTGCLETDAIRPGVVQDLGLEKVEEGGEPRGIRLSWTAPGGDGDLGRAMCYEVRFLNRPITDENWRDAIPLERGKPMPGPAGVLEEFTYRGFPFDGSIRGTTLYVRLQARDEAGNRSPLSNQVSVSYEGGQGPPPEPGPGPNAGV